LGSDFRADGVSIARSADPNSFPSHWFEGAKSRNLIGGFLRDLSVDCAFAFALARRCVEVATRFDWVVSYSRADAIER
jgi:hypothetical protein